MAKAGWKVAKRINQIDSGLAALKSNTTEAKNFMGAVATDTELVDPPPRKQKLDPLTDYLGCTRYYSQMRWVWFTWVDYGRRRPLEVSRYYDEKNLAIDIAPQDRTFIEEKAKLLKDHGITYIVLDSAGDIANLQGAII